MEQEHSCRTIEMVADQMMPLDPVLAMKCWEAAQSVLCGSAPDIALWDEPVSLIRTSWPRHVRQSLLIAFQSRPEGIVRIN